MVWSQYKDEANLINDDDTFHLNQITGPLENYSGRGIKLEINDWITYYSDDLHNLWSSITEYKHDACIDSQFLNKADFGDFCEFCYNMSTKKN